MRKRLPLIPILLLIFEVSLAVGAYVYILHYMTEKRGVIEVVENSWRFSLFKFSNFTGEVEIINFGVIESPPVDTWVNTSVYWIGNIDRKNPLFVAWNYTAPEGWKVKAYFGGYLDGILKRFVEWKPCNGTVTEDCLLGVCREPWIRRVKWSIMVPANTPPGNYTITIYLYGYEKT